MKQTLTRKDAVAVAAVCLAVFATAFDSSVVLITIPVLANSSFADAASVSGVMLFFLLSLSGTLLIFGRLGDRYGWGRMITLGFPVFAAGSLSCSLSPGIDILLFSRLVQGLGGAMLLSSYGAIVAKYLPETLRGKIFGIITFFAGGAFTLGFSVGGLVLTRISWRWNFAFNVVVCVAGAILSIYAFKGKRSSQLPEKAGLDMAGGLLSLIFIVCLFYLLQEAGRSGHNTGLMAGVGSGALLALILFVAQELKTPQPLLDFRIFKNTHLSLGIIAVIMVNLLFDGFNYINPFYFDFVKKLSSARTGIIMMIFPLASMVVGPVAGYLSDRWGAHRVNVASAALLLFSCGLFISFNAASGMGLIIVSLLVFGIAIAAFFTANISQIMSQAPPGKEGVTGASKAVGSYVGTLVGVWVFSTVFSHSVPAASHTLVLSHVPVKDIMNGYTSASRFGIVFAVMALAAAWVAKEKRADVKK